jgi:formylglycine-generating enzyme required for sulfatase activity/archaellum component FlaG (FlaF/FlaG flagellin family)
MSDQQSRAISPSAFEPRTAGPTASRRTLNPLRTAILVTLLTFVAVMLFLLTSRSVQIIASAESEVTLDISGGLLIPFGDRYLMRPGEYSVAASATGYHDLATALIVSEEDSQTLELVLAPLPGLISFSSEPTGAAVFIDGEAVGKTPIDNLSVEAGEHTLKLAAERYLPLAQALSVTGRQLPQQYSLALSPGWADITVSSEPAGADVLVDGEIVGQTPASVEILQGDRQLMLQKAAFAPWQQGLAIKAGEAQDLGTVTLSPANGLLTLSSVPSGANVTVDGEFRGQTPLEVELSPGRSHRLNLSRAGYRRHNENVTLDAGASDSRDIKLRALLGEVQFRISPPEAILRIAGKPRGKGSQTLSLPAYEQSVEVSLDGYKSVRTRVTPRQGLEQVIDVTLQTEQEARLARIQPEITTALGQTLLLFNPQESPRSEFTMGASRREAGRRSNEVLHPVALERMFYLQTTEVTNAQFRQFFPGHNSGLVDGNSLNREHQPAVQVSWQQAVQFANWLSRREGLPPFYRETNGIVVGYNPDATGYRLPAEAEWAWAARVDGESILKFTWGDSFPPVQATENYADNTSAHITGRILNGYTDGHIVSAPVASFSANKKGLYDLGGNVAEWVHDVYTIPSPNGSTEVDPLGAQSGDNFVIRGAAWGHSKISELRLAHRDYGQAGRDDVGFRLARYAE